MSKPLTDREWRFVQMWNGGATNDEIGMELRLAASSIHDWRVRLGLDPRGQPKPRKYSAEELEKLRKLWCEDGLSTSEIARRMGPGWNRNIVGGQITRNGWAKIGRGRASAPIRKAPKEITPRASKPKPVKPIMDRAIKPPKSTTPKAAEGLVTGVAFPPLSPEEADKKRAAFAAEGKRTIKGMDAIANDNAVLLMERKFGQCAWPVGTPDRPRNQLVCGQPVFEGVEKCSYCLTHAKRAFARDVSQPKPNSDLERAARRYAA